MAGIKGHVAFFRHDAPEVITKTLPTLEGIKFLKIYFAGTEDELKRFKGDIRGRPLTTARPKTGEFWVGSLRVAVIRRWLELMGRSKRIQISQENIDMIPLLENCLVDDIERMSSSAVKVAKRAGSDTATVRGDGVEASLVWEENGGDDSENTTQNVFKALSNALAVAPLNDRQQVREHPEFLSKQ
jgi:hypothetical protein